MTHILPIDHRDPQVAAKIHEILMLAYAQEAQLLQVRHFAPLDRTIEDLRAGDEYYLGALDGDELVGALSVTRDDEPDQITIALLVVHPSRQGQGTGRALVTEALRRCNGAIMSVATGARNEPALRLYKALGFAEYRQGVVGPEHIPLVKLRTRAA